METKYQIIIENGIELKREINYYNNGDIGSEWYYNINGKLHRENGPAIIVYNKNKIEDERYCKNDNYHREDGPACIEYDEDGNIIMEKYYLNDVECDLLQEIVIRGLGMEKNNRLQE